MVNTWLFHRSQFELRYFYNQQGFKTPELLFGSWFASQIEKNPIEMHPAVTEVAEKLDIYDRQELVIDDVRVGGYTIGGIIDTCTADFRKISDFKTGKEPWTQERANSSIQLKHYGFLAHEKTGEIPEELSIQWIPTETTEEGHIWFAGDPIKFIADIGKEEIFDYADQLHRIVYKISDCFQQFLGESMSFINESIFIEYAKLYLQKKELDAQLKEAKEKVEKELQIFDLDYYKIEEGTFSRSTKVDWEYPEVVTEEIEEAMADVLLEVERIKHDARVYGDAQRKESTSLRFTPTRKKNIR